MLEALIGLVTITFAEYHFAQGYQAATKVAEYHRRCDAISAAGNRLIEAEERGEAPPKIELDVTQADIQFCIDYLRGS